VTLTTDIMDRYSMDELLEMAATARLYLAGSLVYRGAGGALMARGRPRLPRCPEHEDARSDVCSRCAACCAIRGTTPSPPPPSGTSGAERRRRARAPR